ncbi:universal stress protein [Trinickia sp. LjRoot230]|uniref:universal stress protein n=1 Tax=Trinickia sp. LjRoot230 TaxID=3342288 RepID=UPI003ECC7E1D
MSYKTLLVHIDDSRHNDMRLAFALDLANRHGARLIGLYVVCQDMFRPMLQRDGALSLATLESQSDERMSRAHDQFVTAAGRAGCAFEWRAPSGSAIDAATLHARHADLVVVSQEASDDERSHIARDFVADLVMEAGRPVIVLPCANHISSFGENVIIAWDGSREAARAISDALPILKRARFVTVSTVAKHPDDKEPAGIDVSAYLERHGVRASFTVTPRPSGSTTGATLLELTSTLHADLLVMGAYAHARALERAVGGVTRTVLGTMTVPVLMSR